MENGQRLYWGQRYWWPSFVSHISGPENETRSCFPHRPTWPIFYFASREKYVKSTSNSSIGLFSLCSTFCNPMISPVFPGLVLFCSGECFELPVGHDVGQELRHPKGTWKLEGISSFIAPTKRTKSVPPYICHDIEKHGVYIFPCYVCRIRYFWLNQNSFYIRKPWMSPIRRRCPFMEGLWVQSCQGPILMPVHFGRCQTTKKPGSTPSRIGVSSLKSWSRRM